jgi:hypothetical protein
MPEEVTSQIYYGETEIGPMAQDLKLKMWARFWEDEESTVPAPNIVNASETYFVRVEWQLTGELARHFCGVWRVKIDLESIGAAEEYSSQCFDIPMDPCQEGPYSKVFRLNAGDLKPAACGTVYIVTTTLSSLDPCGKPGHLWGFTRGPTVMFVP